MYLLKVSLIVLLCDLLCSLFFCFFGLCFYLLKAFSIALISFFFCLSIKREVELLSFDSPVWFLFSYFYVSSLARWDLSNVSSVSWMFPHFFYLVLLLPRIIFSTYPLTPLERLLLFIFLSLFLLFKEDEDHLPLLLRRSLISFLLVQWIVERNLTHVK